MLQLDQSNYAPMSEKCSPSVSKPLYGKSSQKSAGRWTKEEHQRFIDGLKKFGKNWKQVEEYVATRNGAQIRSHAQKFFNRLEREYNLKFEDLNHQSDKKKFEETLRKISEGSSNTTSTSQEDTFLQDVKLSDKLEKTLSPIPESLDKHDILTQNSVLSTTLSLSNSPKLNLFEYQSFPKKSFRKMSEDLLSAKSYSLFDIFLSRILTCNNKMTSPRLSDLVDLSSSSRSSFDNAIMRPTPIRPIVGNEPFLNSSFRLHSRKMSEDNVLIHSKLNQLRKPDDTNFGNFEFLTKKFKVN
jgi:SHAQKYF class myb-like DNA-binding protein